MLGICTLSHGNADPERGFSINKYLLNVHGTSTSQKTIEAIRLVKDFIIMHGGVSKIDINKTLIKKCSEARKLWEEDLKASREAKEKEEKAKKELSEKQAADKEKKSKEKQIKDDIKKVECSLKISDDLLSDGQKDLEELTKSSSVDRVKLLSANAKITASLKRKRELQTEKDELTAKLLKLDK